MGWAGWAGWSVWVCRPMENVIAIAHARELCFRGVPAKLVRLGCLGFSLFIAQPAVLCYFLLFFSSGLDKNLLNLPPPPRPRQRNWKADWMEMQGNFQWFLLFWKFWECLQICWLEECVFIVYSGFSLIKHCGLNVVNIWLLHKITYSKDFLKSNNKYRQQNEILMLIYVTLRPKRFHASSPTKELIKECKWEA